MDLASKILLSIFIFVLALTVVLVLINRQTYYKKISRKTPPKFSRPITQVEDFEEDTIMIEPASNPVTSEVVETNIQLMPAQNDQNHDDMIVLGLIAEADKPYAGHHLMQVLLNTGLRYGDMDIFHYYDENNPEQKLFSLASAKAPGKIDINKIGGFSTSGLSLFLPFAKQDDLMKAFEKMLGIARQLTADLGGEIWDDERQKLTEDKIHFWRQRIKKFEAMRHTSDLFA